MVEEIIYYVSIHIPSGRNNRSATSPVIVYTTIVSKLPTNHRPRISAVRASIWYLGGLGIESPARSAFYFPTVFNYTHIKLLTLDYDKIPSNYKFYFPFQPLVSRNWLPSKENNYFLIMCQIPKAQLLNRNFMVALK